ncbi:SDR family NAD(P)-dependent oxidoreductase, partial [Streptomyces sp. NPDC001851]|uniref:type I polyketide synthase n=1 Tax=Streptomyces sp. NPDC001851 TaxID=3154529 RepID=UPI00331802CB
AIAAVNGPRAVVVSGDEDAVVPVVERLELLGRKTRRLTVSHAFHSPRMDGMLAEFREIAAGLTYHTPRIPVVSNVTGELADAARLGSADYWAQHVREAVRFADGVRTLAREGVTNFVELGPDGVLTALVEDTLDGEQGEHLALPLLRRDRPETGTLVAGLGQLHATGVPVDWHAFFAGSGARRVDLPTYAFRQERFWLDAGTDDDEAGGAGTNPTGHPLLGAALDLAGADEALFTSRISVRNQPWLADHTVFGSPVLSAGAVVELVARAGQEAGASGLAELLLRTPLVLPAEAAVRLQVRVGVPEPEGSEDAGRRAVAVYARPDTADASWTLHAEGHLEAGDGGIGELDPAVLDTALLDHSFTAGEGTVLVPAEWRGVRIHSAVTESARARLTETGENTVAVQLFGERGELLATVDSVRYREVAEEEFTAASGVYGDALFRVEWTPVTATVPHPGDALHWALLGTGAGPDTAHDLVRHEDVAAVGKAVDAGVPLDTVLMYWPSGAAESGTALRAATHRVLALVQDWLADERLVGTPLVVVTTGGAAVGAQDSVDLEAATVRGLLRSVQAEHPARLVLVDIEPVGTEPVGTEPADAEPVGAAPLPTPLATFAAALASGEPETAVRDGRLLAPRLGRVPLHGGRARTFDPEGTVLITGGTGALGGLFARHLASRHGVRHLLLVGRGGQDTDGAEELAAELTALGADVTFAACDVADREALAAVLGAIPAEHRLTAVVHAAGTSDIGAVPALDSARLGSVLRPKADGAWHLHELTRDMDLAAFVLFSDSAGTLGGAGRAGYAAANAHLDALAAHRAALGLPATSLAWGLWDLPQGAGGINAGLDEASRERLLQDGLRPLTPPVGTALFDAALSVSGSGAPADTVLLATPVNLSAMRAHGSVPALFRTLAGLPARAATHAGAGAEPLARRLAGLDDEERQRLVLDLVRTQVADTLRRADPASVGAERPFQDMGFDSLTAVDLRNRLKAETGLPLPATLIFDHPSPAALTQFILAQAAADEQPGATSVLAELDGLEAAIASAGPDGLDRTVLTERLRVLLARLDADRTEEEQAPDAASRLADASADEIFDFIDSELGRGTN